MAKKWIIAFFLLLSLTLGLLTPGCLGLVPDINSEDCDLDGGGCDLPEDNFDVCEEDFPKLYTLSVEGVENGILFQEGKNTPDNPAILQVGNIFGPDPKEEQTRLLLEFVTVSPNYFIGEDPENFQVILHLLFSIKDGSAPFFMNANLIDNEQVFDEDGNWVGNRIARWLDPLALFDWGCADCPQLNQTYKLQSCKGDLIDPKTGGIIDACSQPFYIQPQFSP